MDWSQRDANENRTWCATNTAANLALAAIELEASFSQKDQPMTRYLPAIVRYLLGALFAFSGIAGLFNLVPVPPPPERLVPFMTGLMSTGYFFPLLKGTEAVCGILLLSNRFVPLALVVLSPIIVQIAAFHFLFQHSGLVMAAVLIVAQAYLGWAYRSYFRGVLSVKAEPAHSADAPRSGRLPVTATISVSPSTKFRDNETL